MKISLLTVNYNTEDHILNLLFNLQQQNMLHSDFEIIISNNSSSEKLQSLLKDNVFSFKINLIDNKCNLGFGEANNVAAKVAKGKYLLIINPDITLVETDYLSKLFIFAELHPEYGLISTRVIEQYGQQRGPFFHYAYGKVFDELPGEIASVIGALMLLHRNFYLKIGGFDREYFLYEEDIDLCLRVRKCGYSIFVYDELSVQHVGGVSEKATQIYDYQIKKKRGIYLFCLKHYTENEFQHLLRQDLRDSRWRTLKLWVQVNLLGISSKSSKYEYWLANLYCAKKTLESTGWLFNNDSQNKHK